MPPKQNPTTADLLRLFAVSYKTNPCNLECAWYGEWYREVLQLADSVPFAVAIPQMNLFKDHVGEMVFLTGDKDVEETVPKSDRNLRQQPAVNYRDADDNEENEEDEEEGNESFNTISGIPNIARIPDIVLYLLHVVKGKEEGGGAWEVQNRKVGLLVEQKRAPSRKVKPDMKAHKAYLEYYIYEAILDVEEQVVIAWHENPGLQSVIAIATSGSYWSWKKLHCEGIKQTRAFKRVKEKYPHVDFTYDDKEKVRNRSLWRFEERSCPVFQLGTAE
ncbi:hypothetical protein ABKN59_002403 [Abortiporus biennis]